MAVGYQRPHLLVRPEFATLLAGLSVPVSVAIAVGLVLPMVSATALGIVVWIGRRWDRMALLFALGLLGGFVIASRATFVLASISPGLRPLMMAVDVISLVSLVLVVFLFPTGTFQPSWSRWLAYAVTGFLVAVPTVGQTIGVIMAGGSPPNRQIALVNTFAVTLVVFGWVAQVIRYRRWSEEMEKRQIRWVFFTMGLLLFLVMIMLTVFSLPDSPPVWAAWIVLAGAVVGALLPATVGVALFRYHLYDIDLVIKRTILYGIVFWVLIAVYTTSVIFLRGLLPGEGSLAVAASTLLTVALLNPLRKRVGDVVDRAFYRSHYDARGTVEEFSERLSTNRGEDQLRADLLNTIARTLTPATIGIWPDSNNDDKRPSPGSDASSKGKL